MTNNEIQRMADSMIMNFIDDSDRLDRAWKIADAFARSGAVPEAYNKNTPACFVAITMASELKVSPMYYMQHSYPIKGKIGYDAQIMHALLNKSGVYPDGVEFIMEGEGETRKCTVRGITASGKIEQESCSIELAKSNGWYHTQKGKDGEYYSKFKLLPELMLKYRALAFLVRVYHPEVLQGGYYIEELREIPEAKKTEGASFNEDLKSANAPTNYAVYWLKECTQDQVLWFENNIVDKYLGNCVGDNSYAFETKLTNEKFNQYYLGDVSSLEEAKLISKPSPEVLGEEDPSKTDNVIDVTDTQLTVEEKQQIEKQEQEII